MKSLTEIAKELGISVIVMNDFLVSKGVICRLKGKRDKKTRIYPTLKYRKCGVFACVPCKNGAEVNQWYWNDMGVETIKNLVRESLIKEDTQKEPKKYIFLPVVGLRHFDEDGNEYRLATYIDGHGFEVVQPVSLAGGFVDKAMFVLVE